MSLDNLSTSALEALLAFHVEAARNVEDRLRVLSSVAVPPTRSANEDAENTVQHRPLQSPFNPAAAMASLPSTPVHVPPPLGLKTELAKMESGLSHLTHSSSYPRSQAQARVNG